MARATGQVAYVGVVRASDFTAVATYAHMDVVNTDGVRLLLKSQASIEPRKLYVSKTEQILVAYYGDERGRVYVAATLKDYPTRLAYLLLEELQSKFLTKAGDKVHNAAEDSLSRSCRGIFREICERYAHPSEVDHLSALQQQLDTVTTTMQDNIKSMLQNEHKLQDILAQSGEWYAKIRRRGRSDGDVYLPVQNTSPNKRACSRRAQRKCGRRCAGE